MARERYDQVLNRIVHHPDYNPDDFLIIYKHREAPHGLKSLRASALAHVSREALVLRQGTQIPCHRVVQIRNHRTGEILAGEALELDEETWKDLLGAQRLAEVEVKAPKLEAEEKDGAASLPQLQGITVAIRVAYPEEGEYSWTEALRPFTEVGAVEVAFHKTRLFLDNVDIHDVAAPFSELPTRVASIHMAHAKLTKPEVFAATVEKTLRIAKALSCPLIIVHPSYGSFKGRLQEIEAFFAHKIDPLLERAGVLLCWETFASKRRFLSGIEGIVAFCRGRPWHAACYDTSHLLKPQAEVLADIKSHINVIKCFHLSNRAGGQGEVKQHLPLRHPEGELDFAEILKAIVESSFSGAITLEYMKEYHDRLVEDALWVKGQLGAGEEAGGVGRKG